MRLLVMLLLAAQVLHEVQAKASLLFINKTEIEETVSIEGMCVSVDYNDAIGFTISSDNYVTYDVAANIFKPVPFDWTEQGWARDYAYKATFGPITDYTWEMFPTIETHGYPITKEYDLKQLVEIKILNQFELNFSFLGKSDAYIYLCTNTDDGERNCFVGGFGISNGTESSLLLCQGHVAHLISANVLSENCQSITDKITHEAIFSENQWSQISIKYLNQYLEVIIDNTSLLSYNAPDINDFNKYTKIFIHSGTENASWKYHEYSYYEMRSPKMKYVDSSWFNVSSNQLCISLLANYKHHITMKLFNSTDSKMIINEVNYQSDKNTKWNYKTFNTFALETGKYLLRIEYNPDDIVAIREVIFHENDECNDNTLNDFHYSSLDYKTNRWDNINITCSSLLYPHIQLTFENVNEVCGVELCTEFYNSSVCPHMITCSEDTCFYNCSVSHGYTTVKHPAEFAFLFNVNSLLISILITIIILIIVRICKPSQIYKQISARN